MSKYFTPKNFEVYKNKSIYEYLGIKHFKKYLITDGDVIRRKRNIKQINLKENDRIDNLKKAEQETRKFEIIHLFFLIITIFIILFNFQRLSVFQWIAISIINLYANVYPIFLQRYNRFRILKLLK